MACVAHEYNNRPSKKHHDISFHRCPEHYKNTLPDSLHGAMESIILSSWDHIMGPQIEKLWFNICGNNELSEVSKNILFDFNISKLCKTETNSAPKNLSEMKIYSIMCGQLMLSEVDSCKSFEQWVSRFYVSEYKIVVAVVFRLKTWISCVVSSKKLKDVCLCFATIFKHDKLGFVLNNQEIIDFHLRKGVNTISNNEITFDEAVKNLEKITNELAALIFSLYKSSLERHQMPCPSLQDFLHLEIICRAIVSHFKTVGCTIVLGSSEFAINQVISVLSSFNSQKESCTLAHSYTSKSYVQGIHIQGVIKDTDKESEHLLEQAARGLFPLTVVDVNLGKVWQTIPIKNGDSTFKNSVILVEEKGYLVPELLKDLKFIQATGGDFRPLLKNFCNYLMSKSATIIKIIEQTSGCGVSLTANELQSILNVPCLVDLQILFGCAERLKPGIRSTII